MTHRGSDKTITGPKHMVTWSDIVEAGNILIDLRNDTMSVHCFGSGSSQIMSLCMLVMFLFFQMKVIMFLILHIIIVKLLLLTSAK